MFMIFTAFTARDQAHSLVAVLTFTNQTVGLGAAKVQFEPNVPAGFAVGVLLGEKEKPTVSVLSSSLAPQQRPF